VAAYMPSSRFFERKARFDFDRKDFAMIKLMRCVVGGGEGKAKAVALTQLR